MQRKIYISVWLLLLSLSLHAQQPNTKPLRVVDTLTAQEKINRNPIILKAELDSLIKQFNDSQPKQVVREPVNEISDNTNKYITVGLLVIILLLVFIIYMVYRYQNKANRTIAELGNKSKQTELKNENAVHVVTREKKVKMTSQSLESKVNDLNEELKKLSIENEGLSKEIKEYNGIQGEYDSIRTGILKAYKVKNYPGYDKTKDETQTIRGVLQTEYSIAAYAYEKFLKPILAIADANKNNPAKINVEEQAKLLDLLISLSLLYIEYLYLRVNDLSIGGKMVERIQGFSKGNGLDATLLKKLNTEFGNRALVIKMLLEKLELHQLSYPVFDETNLNNK